MSSTLEGSITNTPSPTSTGQCSVLDRSTILPFLLVVLQLGLLTWLIQLYAVEESLLLPQLMPIIFGGFLVHALLPLAFRRPFFLLLSGATAIWFFSWLPGVILLGLTLAFWGILRLPYSTRTRMLLLGLSGGLLAFVWWKYPSWIPGSSWIIPVVGSMFMFRASIYLYESKHWKTQPGALQSLSYFLLLPNLIFTLFPVVDWKVFQNTYYNQTAETIYQKGIRWMVRGFFHLLLYRILYYFVQVAPFEISSLAELAFYAAVSYALILKLSGLFHFSAGVLCLFGYNLPPVFHNYFLATGFSDLWRRINIYWRDYVMKVFYLPIYFAFRGMSRYPRLILSTLIAFVITWFLHSYQWFWIQGTFPIRLVDMLFWGILGLCVAGNAVFQQAVPRARRGSKDSEIVGALVKSGQIIGMLSFMAMLWTFWNCGTLAEWQLLIQPAKGAGLSDWLKLLARLGAGWLLLALGLYLFRHPKVAQLLEPDDGGQLSVFWSFATLLVFSLLAQPLLQSRLQPFTEKPIEHLLENRLNEADEERRLRGYYEDILQTSPLQQAVSQPKKNPEDWVNFARSSASIQTGDWRKYDLRPDTTVVFKGAPLQTNRFGMRDQNYDLAKPPGTTRIALLGGSYVMGAGVPNEDVFEYLLEDRLNETDAITPAFEILNFAAPGYHAIHSAHRMTYQVPDWDVDIVIVFSHGLDELKNYQTIREVYMLKKDIDLDFVPPLAASAGITPGTIPFEDYEEAKPFAKQLTKACYAEIAQACQLEGILPIFVFWPQTGKHDRSAEQSELLALAEQLGYIIVNMGDVYDLYDPEDLRVSQDDGHPNQLGHQLVADHLFEAITNTPSIIDFIHQNGSRNQ
jgi:hypothetical protein